MVYVFLANGVEEVEAVAPIDMLRRAGIRVVIVKVSANTSDDNGFISTIKRTLFYDDINDLTVTGSHNIEIVADLNEKEIIFTKTPDKLAEKSEKTKEAKEAKENKEFIKFANREEYEEYAIVKYVSDLSMIILPGGAAGVENLYHSEIVQKVIAYCVENKIPIGAICAAPSILARQGYLKDVTATAHPLFRHYLTENGAVLEVNQKVVTDGIFTTAAAAGVSTEFGLELVSILKGADEAKKIGEQILLY